MHPLTGTWMPDLALQTSNGATRVAELMRTARPILLNLAGSSDAVRVAAGWSHRVDVLTASCSSGDRVAGAVLIRPDGYVASASDPGTTTGITDGLVHALRTWFGQRASR